MRSTPSRAPHIPHDWNLPNADLALTWKMQHSAVLALRTRLNAPAPRWNLRRPHTRTDPDYLKALEAERARAGAAR